MSDAKNTTGGRTPRERADLASDLEALRDFRFSWNQQARRASGGVRVAVTPRVTPRGEAVMLVTLFAGFPPPPSVAGLRCEVRRHETGRLARVGYTDARGQFWLRGLEAGTYRLEVEALCPGPLVGSRPVSRGGGRGGLPEPAGLISAHFAGAHGAGAEVVQEFHSDDPGQTVHAVIALSGGRLPLQVEVRADTPLWGGRPLARFRVSDDDQALLVQGFVGLYDLGGGRAFGSVDLNRLAPELRQWLPAGCYLLIDPQDPDLLGEADRPDLERSRLGADDPRCRVVLSDSLARVDQALARRMSALVEQLRDPDLRVRAGAARALGEIGPAAAVPALLPLLGDEEWQVRRAAAEALGSIGPAASAAGSGLTGLLGDPRGEVRAAAEEALARLGRGIP